MAIGGCGLDRRIQDQRETRHAPCQFTLRVYCTIVED